MDNIDMKVVFLYEYREASANYNIAKKMVEGLEKKGVTVYSGYYVSDNISAIEQLSLKNDISTQKFTIQSPNSCRYLIHKYDEGWRGKGIFQKLIYIFKNPGFLFSILEFNGDRKFGYRSCQSRIENLCKNEDIDLIIGLSAPFCIEKLVRKINVSIPIFAFRLDPYAFNPCMPSDKANQRKEEEKNVLAGIDKLFTTGLIINDLKSDSELEKFSDKFCEIEFPLINEKDLPDAEEDEPVLELFEKKGDNVYIFHAGTFYNDIRNPKKLVDFMKSLPEKYTLIVAGINSYEIRNYDDDIRNRIIDLGCLSRAEVNWTINKCDFLITYNNLNTNMVPSKLFECIDSGKPFINLCQSNQCPTIEYVKDYDMAFTVILGEYYSKKALIEFMKNTIGHKVPRTKIVKTYRKCTISYVVDKIIEEYEMIDTYNKL